ncbi:MAG: PQQ-binding-like beta-propeller repeat protein [Gemmataceae bacterium]
MRRILLAAIAALTLIGSTARGENWPSWRGPSGVGFVNDKDLPLEWDGKTGKNILWQASLDGLGNSSPIVWGDKVFVSTSAKQTRQEEENKQVPAHFLHCLRVTDGKELWRTSIPPGQNPAGYAIYAVPTPVTDGKRVYVWFGSALLAAVDFDGKIVWRKERPGPFKLNPGICTSPILHEDTLILLCDQGGGQGFLQGIDKNSGDVKWEQKRTKASYCNSTPLLLDVNGKKQLIITGSNALEGLDPASGERIWWCNTRGFGASPAFGSGLLYVDSGTSGPGYAVDPTGTGDVSQSHVKWKIDKIPGEYSSPVICGNYVYRTRKPGMVLCWELSSGKEVFSERLKDVSILASPVATAAGRVYFLSTGVSYVLKAGPKFELLAANNLGGASTTGASPAIAAGRIFLRDRQTLYCIGKK